MTIYENIFYDIVRNIFANIFSSFINLEVLGIDNIPIDENYIVASNHIGMKDPPLVCSYVKGRTYQLARRTLFKNILAKKILLALRGIPINREKKFDICSIRYILRIIKNGNSLIVFPEGTRSSSENFIRTKPGLGMIAYKTKLPILPVRIIEKSTFPRKKFEFNCEKSNINIIYGEILRYHDYNPRFKCNNRYQKITELIISTIKKLELLNISNI